MLQPTDRVLAKTLIRMLGYIGGELVNAGLPSMTVAGLFSSSEKLATRDNKPISDGISILRAEINEEMDAELHGCAVSNIVPQPWNDDAGSGV